MNQKIIEVFIAIGVVCMIILFIHILILCIDKYKNRAIQGQNSILLL